MSWYKTLKIPFTLNDDPKDLLFTLDEDENLYITCVCEERCVNGSINFIRLYIYNSKVNIWQRHVFEWRSWAIYLELLCVRKNLIYAICCNNDQDWYLITLNLTRKFNTCDVLLEKFNEPIFYYEIYDNELRFYTYIKQNDDKFLITGCEIFHLIDLMWDKQNLSKFNALLESKFDYHISLRSNALYVKRPYGLKKYDENGCWQWVYENPLYQYVQRPINCKQDKLIQWGNYFCFFEDSTLVKLSVNEIRKKIQRINCPFQTKVITCTSNRMYFLKYRGKETLELYYIYLDCPLLEEMAMNTITHCLNQKDKSVVYHALYSRIGKLAKLF